MRYHSAKENFETEVEQLLEDPAAGRLPALSLRNRVLRWSEAEEAVEASDFPTGLGRESGW